MSLNKLVGRAVILGTLVTCGICLAYAGEPGAERQPTISEIQLEGPNYAPLPRLSVGQTLPPEPLPQGVDSWETSASGAVAPPSTNDPRVLREWRQAERDRMNYELKLRQQAHREEMDRMRMEERYMRNSYRGHGSYRGRSYGRYRSSYRQPYRQAYYGPSDYSYGPDYGCPCPRCNEQSCGGHGFHFGIGFGH